MAAEQSGQTLFARAQAAAGQLLQGLPEHTAVHLAYFDAAGVAPAAEARIDPKRRPGHGGTDYEAIRTLAWIEPELFDALMDRLVSATSAYLIAQADAGAEALQLFDTWAGSVAAPLFGRAVIGPTARIVAAVKARHPHLPIIARSHSEEETAHLMRHDVVREPLPIASGPRWGVPDGPGLGVELDEAAVAEAAERYRAEGQYRPWQPEQLGSERGG